MTTPLAICSAALLMIGADEISSFDETSREAKLCANLYDTTRDELLQLYPWRFAVGQMQLPKLQQKRRVMKLWRVLVWQKLRQQTPRHRHSIANLLLGS